MSTTLGCEDIEIRKSKFVAEGQFLYFRNPQKNEMLTF